MAIQMPESAKPQLPDHQLRRNATPIIYRGLLLFFLTEYAPTHQYPGGALEKITISYRDPAGKRSKTGYGSIVLSRYYKPICEEPIPRGAQVPESIVLALLDRIFFKSFLPALLEKRPEILTPESRFDLVAPYALARLNAVEKYSESTRRDKMKSMSKLLDIFASWPISKITPDNCASIMRQQMTDAEYVDARRLLAQLYEGYLRAYIPDGAGWLEKFTKPKPKTNQALNLKKTILNLPLDNSVCRCIIERILSKIDDPKDGRLFLGALLMMLLRLELGEICALSRQSVHALFDYSNCRVLSVFAKIETIGNLKTQTAFGDRRKRKRQHKIKEYSSDDLHRRGLPVGTWLAGVWDKYWASHPNHKSDYLLFNPRNSDRNMPPEVFDDWLDIAFGDLIPDRTFIVAGKEEKSTYRISDFLICTAERVWAQECALSEEAIRRFRADKPTHVDAAHYIDYQSDSALAGFGLEQDRWIDKLFGASISRSKHGHKQHAVDGRAGKILHTSYIIDVPQHITEEMRLAIETKYGGSIHIRFISS